MVNEIKKSQIGLKYTDMANMFNAYSDDDDNSIFYTGKTVTFGNIKQLNEKYIDKHKWQDGDTWYKLAYLYYNNSKLWWIICKANDITNPFNTPANETEINIPRESVMQLVLDRILT